MREHPRSRALKPLRSVALVELAGKLVEFCDQDVPASINLASFPQTLIQAGNTEKFLNSMQSEYDKIEARNFR